jgi:hypothetical protein
VDCIPDTDTGRSGVALAKFASKRWLFDCAIR